MYLRQIPPKCPSGSRDSGRGSETLEASRWWPAWSSGGAQSRAVGARRFHWRGVGFGFAFFSPCSDPEPRGPLLGCPRLPAVPEGERRRRKYVPAAPALLAGVVVVQVGGDVEGPG